MNDLRTQAETLLKGEIAASLELDPAGLDVISVEDGIASVRLGPVCAACPATMTVLVMQLEAELRDRLPEIEIVQAVP